MKVYVLYHNEDNYRDCGCGDRIVDGVTASLEKAKAHDKRWKSGYEEFELEDSLIADYNEWPCRFE